MKLYLQNYKPADLFRHLVELDKYFLQENIVQEIYSEEGMFQVTNNKIYKLNVTDKPAVHLSNDFIVDTSTILMTESYQIPTNHIAIMTTQYIYQCKSGIQLVVEGTFTKNKSANTKYLGYEPNNFYFNVQTEKDDLGVFLSIIK
jgi:hypothetical protein